MSSRFCHAVCCLIPGVLLICLMTSCTSSPADKPDSIRPELRDDVKALYPFLENVSASVHHDPNILPLMATPYGPLDLQVSKPVSFEESSYLKNYYLGSIGAVFGLSQEETAELVNGPLCGPSCTEGYKKQLTSQLDDLEKLVAAFHQEEDLKIYALARSTAPVVRINNLFYGSNNPVEHIPYGEAGLVPSPNTKHWESLEAYMDANSLDRRFMVDFLEAFSDSGICAIVKDDPWTWLVLYGVSDNEAGVIFIRDGANPPKVGEKRLNGKEFVTVEELRDGIWYYETG